MENKIKGQVAAAMKRQKEEDKEEQKKETKELEELARLIYVFQSADISYNASNGNAATAEVRIDTILK